MIEKFSSAFLKKKGWKYSEFNSNIHEIFLSKILFNESNIYTKLFCFSSSLNCVGRIQFGHNKNSSIDYRTITVIEHLARNKKLFIKHFNLQSPLGFDQSNTNSRPIDSYRKSPRLLWFIQYYWHLFVTRENPASPAK